IELICKKMNACERDSWSTVFLEVPIDGQFHWNVLHQNVIEECLAKVVGCSAKWVEVQMTRDYNGYHYDIHSTLDAPRIAREFLDTWMIPDLTEIVLAFLVKDMSWFKREEPKDDDDLSQETE